jgi:WD40 repeat protein
VRIWDLTTRQQSHIITNHLAPIHGVTFIYSLSGLGDGPVKLAFDSKGRYLAAGAGQRWADVDRTIRVWDTATMQEICAFAGHDKRLTGLSLAPDGRHIASSGLDGPIGACPRAQTRCPR